MHYFPQPCKCECHRIGNNIMHEFPCCRLSGLIYQDKDGNVDYLIYKECLSFIYPKQKVPYIDGGEYMVKNKYNYDSTSVKDKRK